MTQEQVDKLYKKAYVTLMEARSLMGLSRPGMWYLVDNGTFNAKRDESGKPFISTVEIRKYVIQFRKKLLDRLDKLKLPTT